MPSGFPKAPNSKSASTSSSPFWKEQAEQEVTKAITTVNNTLNTLSHLQSSLSALDDLCKEWEKAATESTKVSSPTLSSS